MKNKRNAITETVIIIVSITIFILILAFYNKFLTFDITRIDWSATAAMLGSYCGFVAIIINSVSAHELLNIQHQQNEKIEKLREQSKIFGDGRKVFHEAILLLYKSDYPKIIDFLEEYDSQTTFILESLNDLLGLMENCNLAFRYCEAYFSENEEKHKIDKLLNDYQSGYLPTLKKDLNNLNRDRDQATSAQIILIKAREAIHPIALKINQFIRDEYRLKTTKSD